ncbi:unnamed protein product [Acanthocheilonema viteae]|uniref:Myotubularin phosphatase domain-containing protein n=1 Tax=Acanthocheilonema viteae TaxID=6277 RepID=A0A498SMH9_ACAVI|nr:unnamed protein product [Acanthocheilonema viteae]
MAFLRSTESKKKRTASTLACLLQAVKGSSIVVELKDFSTVQGILVHCDDAMNVEMKAVTIHDFKHHIMPLHCDKIYASPRHDDMIGVVGRDCVGCVAEKDVQEHLRAVYGTLALGLVAATVGTLLHLFTNILRDNFFLLFGSILLMIALLKTPHTGGNERKRLGYFIAFCALSGMSSGPLIEKALIVDPSTILTAFLATAIVFSCFTMSALHAPSTKFLHLGAFAINCTLVLYDTQLICEKRRRGDTDYILHTIELFIDFINFFRYILAVLSEKKVWFSVRYQRREETEGKMNSGDDSSQDGDFRSDVLAAVGMTPGGSSSLSLIQNKGRHADRFWVLPGEKIQIEEANIGYMSPVGKINGRVLVTNYRLRFEAKSTSENRHSKCCQFDIPLGCISRVEKVGYSTVSRGEDSYGLEITCKDMRNIRFTHQQTNHSRRPLYESLQRFAFPVTNKASFFAASFKPDWTFDGWKIYDTIRELNRMNVPNETWRITKINDRYDFADSYPALLAVPATAVVEGEDFLQKVAEFRSKQRIPVLSWLHPTSQASITRSSQPMVGVTSRKSAEDERYLQMIVEANAHAHQLLIFDARPAVNAKVNKAKGGGFEDSYSNSRLIFLDIQNIHVVRES